MSEFKCPGCGLTLTVAAKPESKRVLNMKDTASLFPEDLAKLLTFSENQGSIILKPKHFLASENFARIAHIARQARGEYISSGKNSHFKIPKIQ